MDRLNVVERVFYMKYKIFIDDMQRGFFGPYLGHFRIMEYQKRGLPHENCLVFLQSRNNLYLQPENIDQLIWAEIPNPNASQQHREIFNRVMAHMIHNPCGEINPDSPCMATSGNQRRCTKHHPKDFNDVTYLPENGYPNYRRRSPEEAPWSQRPYDPKNYDR